MAGPGPGVGWGDSGSCSRSVSTGAGERRGERREGDILVTLHLAPGNLGTWNLGKVAAGVSIAEESRVGHGEGGIGQSTAPAPCYGYLL